MIYEVQTEDFFVDIESKQLRDKVDLSNFPKNHQQNAETNAKVTLKFRDEMGGQTMSEFVGLKPKLYSIKASEAKHLFASFLLRGRQEKSVGRRDR